MVAMAAASLTGFLRGPVSYTLLPITKATRCSVTADYKKVSIKINKNRNKAIRAIMVNMVNMVNMVSAGKPPFL